MANPSPRLTFSDTLAGYITSSDPARRRFELRTADGRRHTVEIAENAAARIVRNLGEDYRDCSHRLIDMLAEGRFVYVYAIFYEDPSGVVIEGKELTFPEEDRGVYVFEDPDWWLRQVTEVADFYLRGHFPDGKYDWRKFRTKLTLAGTHLPEFGGQDVRQETDTISRLVYGLATAYLMTGKERFLEAAETGTDYLRTQMKIHDAAAGIAYWYHGIDITAAGDRKVLASEFGDDYDAIPMYEQIYALAGPVQTYRVTGDPRIAEDLDQTLALFREHFADPVHGGFFSHLDPVALDPKADKLGRNRARKNWNSIGDHAPAYLINAFLATGRRDLADMLEQTADAIVAHFPDEPDSPFVQERFHEDWSPDRSWAWQQDRAVVGHNLKIAWNLTRIAALRPKAAYGDLARRLAETMPEAGSDLQRGGWYDVVERTASHGPAGHRFVWHDRKAWWQQEQAILAYLILAGTGGDPEHLRQARESASFYNAFFLDHDDGGVYYNVLASGLPYLLGNERLKGSHAMAGYHSVELCYLAAVYTGLLLGRHPLTLHFKPTPDFLPGRQLRVAPDLLPAGQVRLDAVWVDDRPWHDYDPEAMIVNLPAGDRPTRVRVMLVPSTMRTHLTGDTDGKTAHVHVRGPVGDEELGRFRRVLDSALSGDPERVEVHLERVNAMCRQAVNELLVSRSKARLGTEFAIAGSAAPQVALALAATDAFVLDLDVVEVGAALLPGDRGPSR
ncbi:AGE family epimerase/isomerase [Actinacidiphila acididurans]|uniref:AGE family epimerase/isomerase n=1 Tax=Actinacidiphila acididurans TaxID=2784346 RepID=A0ABS2TXD9_9ACTN|nr:AGE family epimerase/isomerase [Actinacidiphila acididurans]MBM9507457.1 AGE family epimerase/isomerase [Actinacidiphila acididurans]